MQHQFFVWEHGISRSQQGDIQHHSGWAPPWIASPHSLNSCIHRSPVTIQLDNLHALSHSSFGHNTSWSHSLCCSNQTSWWLIFTGHAPIVATEANCDHSMAKHHVDWCMVFKQQKLTVFGVTFMAFFFHCMDQNLCLYQIVDLLHSMDNDFTYNGQPKYSNIMLCTNTPLPLETCQLLTCGMTLDFPHWMTETSLWSMPQYNQVFHVNQLICLSTCQLSQRMISLMPSLNSWHNIFVWSHLLEWQSSWVD